MVHLTWTTVEETVRHKTVGSPVTNGQVGTRKWYGENLSRCHGSFCRTEENHGEASQNSLLRAQISELFNDAVNC